MGGVTRWQFYFGLIKEYRPKQEPEAGHHVICPSLSARAISLGRLIVAGVLVA